MESTATRYYCQVAPVERDGQQGSTTVRHDEVTIADRAARARQGWARLRPPAWPLSHSPAAGISRGMDAPFHAGELEVQRRAGVVEEARRVAAIIAPGLPAGVEPFLARQRLAVAATHGADGRVWASLITGPPGFLAPVGEDLLRIGARWIPGDPLLATLAARPELGLLAIDPGRRQRMRSSCSSTAPTRTARSTSSGAGWRVSFLRVRRPVRPRRRGSAAR
jgi:hypothetical protein